MALIIGERLATLRELEEYYSFADALNLAEVVQVQRFNENSAMHESRK